MWEKIQQSTVFSIIIVILAVFLGINAYRTVRQSFALQEEVVRERGKIEELRRKKAEIEANLAELQTKGAIEREAKSRLNLKLPGEEVVVVVPEKKEEVVSTSSPRGFWERIRQRFKFLQ